MNGQTRTSNLLVNGPGTAYSGQGQIALFESVNATMTAADGTKFDAIGIGSSTTNIGNYLNTYRYLFTVSNSTPGATGLTLQIRGVQTPSGTYNGNTQYVAVSLAPGATSWTSASDRRHKNVLSNITNATSDLETLSTVYFAWKNDATQTSRIGLLAQEVAQVYPDAVEGNEDTENMMGVKYTELIPPLIAAVKELSARLSNVEAKLAATTTTV